MVGRGNLGLNLLFRQPNRELGGMKPQLMLRRAGHAFDLLPGPVDDLRGILFCLGSTFLVFCPLLSVLSRGSRPRLAAGREVLLVDTAGVGGSSGETPDNFDAVADGAAEFVQALGLKQVDLLGFSIGGYVAQTAALRHSALIRRLVLVGTGPRAGEPSADAKVLTVARNPIPVEDDFLYLFFAPSANSQKAGHEFWQRRHRRTVDVDPPTTEQTMRAQTAAFAEFRQPRVRLRRSMKGGRHSGLAWSSSASRRPGTRRRAYPAAPSVVHGGC